MKSLITGGAGFRMGGREGKEECGKGMDGICRYKI